MGRRPTPLDWRPRAEPDPLEVVVDQFLEHSAACREALLRAVCLLGDRVDALERAAQPPTSAAEWLTPTAAAQRYGFHPDSISRWARQGRVRSLGHGSGRRVAVADLEVLARHRGGPG